MQDKFKYYIKIIFKMIFWLVIIKFCAQIILEYTIYNPNYFFRFIKYNTEKQLENAVKKRFPIGSSISRNMSNLQESGAICGIIKPKDSEDYRIIVGCDYKKFWSLHPGRIYSVVFYGDKDFKLVSYKVYITEDMIWP